MSYFSCFSIRCELRELPESQRKYKEAIAIGTGSYSSIFSHFSLGLLYHRQSLMDQAIAEYKQWLESEPKAFWPLFYVGLAYLDRGEPERAKQLWMKTYEDLLIVGPGPVSHIMWQVIGAQVDRPPLEPSALRLPAIAQQVLGTDIDPEAALHMANMVEGGKYFPLLPLVGVLYLELGKAEKIKEVFMEFINRISYKLLTEPDDLYLLNPSDVRMWKYSDVRIILHVDRELGLRK